MTDTNQQQTDTENLDANEPREETFADIEAKERNRSMAQQKMEQEADDVAPWYKKRLPDTWYSTGITSQEEKMAYERAKRLIMALLGGNKQSSPSPSTVERPVGITQGTTSALNGEMNGMATGISQTIMQGVTPKVQPQHTINNPQVKNTGLTQKMKL